MANNGAVAALFVSMGIDTAEFSEGLKKAYSQAGNFGAKFAAIGKTVALAGAAMAASAGAAFVTFGAQALTAADDIGDAAARIGISAESFQKLGAAASAAGGTPELMTAALDKLNVGLGAFVQTGGGPAAQAFKDMGLASKIASGEIQTADQAFYAAAKAMEGIESPAEKARISMQLFGRAAGADMLEVLAAGEQGLKQYGEAAANSGRIMSNEMVEKLPAMKVKLDEAKLALSQMATVFAGQALIGSEKFFNALGPGITEIRKIAVQVGEGLRPTMEALGATFSKLAANQSLIKFLKIVGTIVGGALVLNFKLLAETVNLGAKALDWMFQKIAPMIDAIDRLMPKIAAAFKPATDAMNKFTNTAKKMENDVTKNSYVPDMVDEIVRQMQRSDKAFNDSAQVMQRYVESAKQMAADVRAFDLMSQAERASGAISRADARAARPDFLGNVGALNVKDSPLASTDWIDKWKDGQTKAINDNDQLRSAFANTFSDGLSEALNGNGGNWMKTWFQKTLQNAFQNAMSNLGGSIFDMLKGSGSSGSSGGGLGGIFKSVLSFFTKAPGFATGGSFKVGGSGGTDSKYIGMRLTPGEMVNVSKPGNDNGGQLVIPVSLGGEQIETIMVDIATRQATVVTGAAFQGVSTSQSRAKTYSRFAR
jgi:uncharacterized protein YoxC